MITKVKVFAESSEQTPIIKLKMNISTSFLNRVIPPKSFLYQLPENCKK